MHRRDARCTGRMRGRPLTVPCPCGQHEIPVWYRERGRRRSWRDLAAFCLRVQRGAG